LHYHEWAEAGQADSEYGEGHLDLEQ